MNLPRLILAELLHRRWSALAAVLAVALAVATVVGTRVLLLDFDAGTERAAAAKEAATKEQLAGLQEHMRRITVRMGFNVALLPGGQPLAAYLAGEPPSAWMDESDADRLAAAKPATLNHLTPALTGRTAWPERGRTVAVIGVKGPVFLQSKLQTPIQGAIAPGTLVLGHQLAVELGLKAGDSVVFQGQERRVAAIKSGRGGADDITVWMALSDSQRLFDKPGQISVMLGLECECGADRLEAVRREVRTVLPSVQVVEFSTIAAARAEARERTNELAVQVGKDEREARQRLRADKAGLFDRLIPLAMAGAGLVVVALAAFNARERTPEIGLLRAVGVGTGRVAWLFLGRALVVGLIGAGLGVALGLGAAWWQLFGGDHPWPGIIWLLAVVVAAPLATVLAAAGPALRAALLDPAHTLRED